MNNKKVIYFLIFVALLCTGCSNDAKKLIVEKVEKENTDKKIEIIDKNKVSAVTEIINNSEWKNINQESFDSIKYKIYFAYIDPEKEMKSSYYFVDIISNDQIILIESEKKYTKLSIDNSNIIYDILQKIE